MANFPEQTVARPVTMLLVDERVVVLCDDGSVWSRPASAFAYPSRESDWKSDLEVPGTTEAKRQDAIFEETEDRKSFASTIRDYVATNGADAARALLERFGVSPRHMHTASVDARNAICGQIEDEESESETKPATADTEGE